jgi:hypothetical protein
MINHWKDNKQLSNNYFDNLPLHTIDYYSPNVLITYLTTHFFGIDNLCGLEKKKTTPWVNMLVIKHIVFQSPLSHSIYFLFSCGLKIKWSPLESAPTSFKSINTSQKWGKYTTSKFWGLKID